MNKIYKKMRMLKFNPNGIKILCKSILLFALLSQLLNAQFKEIDDGINGNLVSCVWLDRNLNNPDLILLDASPKQIYNEKHIPGAVSVNSYLWIGVAEIPKNEMENIIRSWGISTGKKIVIYDEGGSIMATRLFFTLYYYGFPEKDLFILNGGLTNWENTGLKVTNEVTQEKESGTFTINELKEDARGKLSETLNASGDTDRYLLIEALEPNWHYGQFKMFGRAGHIPNSILLPSKEFYREDKTFKTPEEISKILDYFKIDEGITIITYCGGGVAASVPFFALKYIMKYTSVKLFVESELGWLKDERELPYWTYDAPDLLRESDWLNTWSGKTLRMYFDPNISVLDIRETKEFDEGHIQFATNIPYSIFKENINSPDKLGRVLSSAGIELGEEVVIVSGKGLSKEAALAFCLLKNLGQKKVSIFRDTIDKWAKLGVTLIKDTLITGKQLTTNETIAPLNNYSKIIQDDVFLNNINEEANSLPIVFIASGESIPVDETNNKVIHLPYANFLNEDGTPKEAKDIWAMIDKAEVPRYTEIICYSEDPGEAAVNYFIFKLMGYPYVKIWVD